MLVAITGYGSQSDKLKAEKAGFDYHFTKPVSYTRLEEILASIH
jgi:CheY-like chemotaxis protein